MIDDIQQLDFAIIGAQKAGTTSLFHYLREHPDLMLPSAKEAPFFHTRRTKKEIAKLYTSLFPSENKNLLLGKVSPQYMTSEEVTENVCNYLQHTKFIAILRDPYSRACSHYRMMLARGIEKRNIDEALITALNESQNGSSSTLGPSPDSETKCYVAWGEYERILAGYLKRIDSKRILVISTMELGQEPLLALNKIFKFLQIDENYIPSNLNTHYFSSGRISLLWRMKSMSIFSPIKKLISHCPFVIKNRIHFWLDETLTIGKPLSKDDMQPNNSTRISIEEHFAKVRGSYNTDYSYLWTNSRAKN